MYICSELCRAEPLPLVERNLHVNNNVNIVSVRSSTGSVATVYLNEHFTSNLLYVCEKDSLFLPSLSCKLHNTAVSTYNSSNSRVLG